MTQVGDPAYSSGVPGRVIRVVGVAPREQIYVDWGELPSRTLVVNPEALPDEPRPTPPTEEVPPDA